MDSPYASTLCGLCTITSQMYWTQPADWPDAMDKSTVVTQRQVRFNAIKDGDSLSLSCQSNAVVKRRLQFQVQSLATAYRNDAWIFYFLNNDCAKCRLREEGHLLRCLSQWKYWTDLWIDYFKLRVWVVCWDLRVVMKGIQSWGYEEGRFTDDVGKRQWYSEGEILIWPANPSSGAIEYIGWARHPWFDSWVH